MHCRAYGCPHRCPHSRLESILCGVSKGFCMTSPLRGRQAGLDLTATWARQTRWLRTVRGPQWTQQPPQWRKSSCVRATRYESTASGTRRAGPDHFLVCVSYFTYVDTAPWRKQPAKHGILCLYVVARHCAYAPLSTAQVARVGVKTRPRAGRAGVPERAGALPRHHGRAAGGDAAHAAVAQQHRRAPPGYPGPPHGCACACSNVKHTSGSFMRLYLICPLDTAKPCIGALAR